MKKKLTFLNETMIYTKAQAKTKLIVLFNVAQRSFILLFGVDFTFFKPINILTHLVIISDKSTYGFGE